MHYPVDKPGLANHHEKQADKNFILLIVLLHREASTVDMCEDKVENICHDPEDERGQPTAITEPETYQMNAFN